MTVAKINWFQMAFQLRGSVIPEVFPRILLCSGLAFLISLSQYFGFSLPEQIFGSVTSNVAYNLVLGLLLVFRTNTAYDRYWEGRKSWGSIIINILNLGRKIRSSVIATESVDKENKLAALRLLSAFAIATKLYLRHQSGNNELEALVTPSQYLQLKEARNTPLQITILLGDYLKQEQLNNRLTMDELIAMNSSLDNMVEALTGCDRILKTPMPLAYAIYLKRLLLIYCVTLPFQLVHDLGWWTAMIVALISFILLGIEEIGNQIEDPFGNDANDLPLDDICSNAVNNIEEVIAKD
jgi:ion channel-forming bestrophin family protein